MNSRTFVILAIASLTQATLAVAGDGPDPSSNTVVASAATAAEFAPMTRSERFRNYLRGLVDPESFLRAGAVAGIRQAEDSPKEWRGGAEGFGDRLGDAFAEHIIRRTLQYGASTALHEDNRYFVSGESGFFRRVKYAVVSTFLARHDSGTRSISFSRIGGDAGAAFISRIWQPRSVDSGGDGAVSFGFAIGADAGFNVFREFLPDLKRHFHKE